MPLRSLTKLVLKWFGSLAFMSGLKIGDITLDPRGLIYIPSIKAIVCSGLKDALYLQQAKTVRKITAEIDSAIERYMPENMIILGSLKDEKSLSAIAKKWSKTLRILLISNQISKEAKAVCEALKMETHSELIWDRYRFVEKFENPPFVDSSDIQAIDFQFMTIAGGSHYFVRIGQAPYDLLGLFSGEKLRVFLRGMGRLKLPSLNPTDNETSIFMVSDDPFFARYDVFALGHSRILPLGKVADAKKFVTLNTLPVKKKALNHRMKKEGASQWNQPGLFKH